MKQKATRLTLALTTLLLLLSFQARIASCWSNGGVSADPEHPDYGTHDWIAEHALEWLPLQEKQHILDHKEAYVYGTELPDRPKSSGGMGDSLWNHSVYFHADGSLQNDIAAVRAQEEYDSAACYWQANNAIEAIKHLGAMTHYISDVAAYGHVMDYSTDWGNEHNHSNYEGNVTKITTSYDSQFDKYLQFDGNLDSVSAYNATLLLANDTTFDLDGDLNCTWMDKNYDWNDPAFENRCGESLNLATNMIADVLHAFYIQVIVPEFPPTLLLPVFMILASIAVLFTKNKTSRLGVSGIVRSRRRRGG